MGDASNIEVAVQVRRVRKNRDVVTTEKRLRNPENASEIKNKQGGQGDHENEVLKQEMGLLRKEIDVLKKEFHALNIRLTKVEALNNPKQNIPAIVVSDAASRSNAANDFRVRKDTSKQCSLCERIFSTPTSRRRHELNIHGIISEISDQQYTRSMTNIPFGDAAKEHSSKDINKRKLSL